MTIVIIIIIIIMSCPGIKCFSNCNPQSERIPHRTAMSVVGPLLVQEHSVGR